MLNTLKRDYYFFYDAFIKQGDLYIIGPYYPVLHWKNQVPVLIYTTPGSVHNFEAKLIYDKDEHTALWRFSVSSIGIVLPEYVTIEYCYIKSVLHLEKERNEKKYEICISTVMKNEYMNIKPWLDFHIKSGVDHFYLYDNCTTDKDRLLSILDMYINEGKVTLIDWNYPYIPNNVFPIPINSYYFCVSVALNHCIHKYGSETDWLLTMDVDEYIVPRTVDTLKEYIQLKDNTSSIGGIYIPDYVFGANNLDETSIVKKFLYRNANISPWLNSGKVIVRPSNVNFVECHIISNGGHLDIADPSVISINHYHYCNKPYYRLQKNESNNEIYDTRCLELWNKYFNTPAPSIIISIKNFGTWSRLGNQMFQYAYLLVLSKAHGFKIQLPRLRSPHGYNQAQFFDSFDIDVEELSTNIKFEEIKESGSNYDEKFDVNNITTTEVADGSPLPNMLFDGYFQTAKYFAGYEEIIKQSFTFKDNIRCKGDEYINTIKSNCLLPLVALHIRRTDTLPHNVSITTFAVTDTFIENAFNYLDTKFEKYQVLIFSDDKDWCKSVYTTPGAQVRRLGHESHIVVDGCTDLEEMYIMSLCDHFVISPSTFSWWSAYLAVNPDKIIIVQNRWFKAHNLGEDDIIQENWVKLPF